MLNNNEKYLKIIKIIEKIILIKELKVGEVRILINIVCNNNIKLLDKNNISIFKIIEELLPDILRLKLSKAISDIYEKFNRSNKI